MYCGDKMDIEVTRGCRARRPTTPLHRASLNRTHAESLLTIDVYCKPCRMYRAGKCVAQCVGKQDLLSYMTTRSYTCPLERWPKLPEEPRKIVLHSGLSPGDILTMTAAVESLHQLYPGRYETAVTCAVPEVWQNNPNVSAGLSVGPNDVYDLSYPAIDRSGSSAEPFLSGYVQELGFRLGIPMRLTVAHPVLYLTDEEKQHSPAWDLIGTGRPYWIINAGHKDDIALKQWPHAYYQKVVDDTDITWVQVGAMTYGHTHRPLRNVIDLRGKTTHRQLYSLVYNASGAVGPVTYLQHIAAAFEKPYVCIAGGREPVSWVSSYNTQVVLHSVGSLRCKHNAGCWRGNECQYMVDGAAECMTAITPELVVETIRAYQRAQG